jgi:large subunit ribosomal protein L24
MARVRKGDLVVVRAGADRGKRGRVLRVLPWADKAVVEGIALQFKHLKKSPKHPQGGRIQREAPVPLARLMPVDPSTNEGTRVAYREEGGVKHRVAVGSGTSLDGDAKTARAEKAPKQPKAPKAPKAAKAPAKKEG